MNFPKLRRSTINDDGHPMIQKSDLIESVP